MAENANAPAGQTQAGDENVETTGTEGTEKPKGDEALEEVRNELAETKEELRRTNAEITRQQQAAAQKAKEEEEAAQKQTQDEETPDGVKQLREALGIEELVSWQQKQEKERQEAEQRKVDQQWQDDLKNVAEKHKESGLPLPDKEENVRELVDHMRKIRTANPLIAFEDMHKERLSKSSGAQSEEAAAGDSGDSGQLEETNAKYREELSKVKPGDLRKLAEVRAKFMPDPYEKQ